MSLLAFMENFIFIEGWEPAALVPGRPLGIRIENQRRKIVAITQSCTVRMHYTLKLESGELIESSFEGEPIEFEFGSGNIIPGLEREIEGMDEGDEKHVVVEPEDAYGETDPAAVVSVPHERFPEDVKLEPGLMLQLQREDGVIMHARVVELTDAGVTLDLNHPLAGESLHFDIKIEKVTEPENSPAK
jgi:FKBP-type peptidyl-prolyl cis-trans isomerase 2